MKKKIVQSMILLLFFSLMFSISNKTIKCESSKLVAGAFEFEKKTEPNISKTDVEIVGESEEIKPIEKIKEENEIDEITVEEDNLEELEVLSEPLVFPDSYFNPSTEEYREEEFWDDCELIALVCVAEAEGESEYGKRLVIDSILNRMDSPYFPNTIYDVVYADNPPQYSCVWDGRLERVEYNEYIAKLVLEEMNNRTNNEVIYFKTNGFFNFGTPLFQEGSHFFSKR